MAWLTQLTGCLVSTATPTLGEQQVDRETGGSPVWKMQQSNRYAKSTPSPEERVITAKLDWTEVLYFPSLLPDISSPPSPILFDDTLPILQGPAWITPPPYPITIVKHNFSLPRTPVALGLKVSYRNFDLYYSCSCACHIYSTRLQSSCI